MDKMFVFIFVVIFLAYCSYSAKAECSKIRVKGTIFQKGIEGEYAPVGDSCNNGYILYKQTEPAAGWGSVFYLYFLYYEHGEWSGWVFSIYKCSDVPFARNNDILQEPDKIAMPWEEFLDGSFVINYDIDVSCVDDQISVVAVSLIALLCAIILVLIGLLPLCWIQYSRRKNTTSLTSQTIENQNTNGMELRTVIRPSPPPYCEEVPGFYDMTFSSSSGFNTTRRRSLTEPQLYTSSRGETAPPTYEESINSNNNNFSPFGQEAMSVGVPNTRSMPNVYAVSANIRAYETDPAIYQSVHTFEYDAIDQTYRINCDMNSYGGYCNTQFSLGPSDSATEPSFLDDSQVIVNQSQHHSATEPSVLGASQVSINHPPQHISTNPDICTSPRLDTTPTNHSIQNNLESSADQSNTRLQNQTSQDNNQRNNQNNRNQNRMHNIPEYQNESESFNSYDPHKMTGNILIPKELPIPKSWNTETNKNHKSRSKRSRSRSRSRMLTLDNFNLDASAV